MSFYQIKKMGFSLIELLMVLVIVSILTSVLYPSYKHYRNKVEQLEAQNILLSLMQAQRLFYSQHHSFTLNLDDVLEYVEIDINREAYTFTAQTCDEGIIQQCVELSAVPHDDENLTLSYNSRNDKTHW